MLPTSETIVFGDMKIPVPMIEPMIREIALKRVMVLGISVVLVDDSGSLGGILEKILVFLCVLEIWSYYFFVKNP